MSEETHEITVGQAAKILGISRQRVHQYLDDHRLRVVRRVAGIRLLDRREVEAFEPRGQGWRGREKK